MATNERGGRVDGVEAYVLHTWPHRETSQLVEVFARGHGRVALVARGSRRPRSAMRGVILAFRPLLVGWFGRSELRTLASAEWQSGQPPLHGDALLCGFYLNELLMRLTARDDPHDALFERYRHALRDLAATRDVAPVLRRFEKGLLAEIGYAPMLDAVSGSASPIDPAALYAYVPDVGPVAREARRNEVELHGKTLIDIASDRFDDPVTAVESKLLMRLLINHHLGDDLRTRALFREVTPS